MHGEEEAVKAAEASSALFSGAGDMENVPSVEVEASVINNGIALTELMVTAKLVPSKSEARRAIEQGGAYVNNELVNDVGFVVTDKLVNDNHIMLRRGKKAYCKVIVK